MHNRHMRYNNTHHHMHNHKHTVHHNHNDYSSRTVTRSEVSSRAQRDDPVETSEHINTQWAQT